MERDTGKCSAVAGYCASVTYDPVISTRPPLPVARSIQPLMLAPPPDIRPRGGLHALPQRYDSMLEPPMANRSALVDPPAC